MDYLMLKIRNKYIYIKYLNRFSFHDSPVHTLLLVLLLIPSKGLPDQACEWGPSLRNG